MLRDSAFSLVSTLVRVLSSLVLFIAMAHAWGPEAFGRFMYPYTIAAVLVKLVDYGFAVQVARDIGRSPGRARGVVARALGAKLALVIPTAAIAAVIAGVLPRGQGYALLLALLLLDAVANSFVLLFSVPLRSLGRFDVEAGMTAWANAVVFCSVIGAITAGSGPVAAAATFAAARLVGLALSWRACHLAVGARPWPSLERASIGVMLRTGLPFGVHAAVNTLNMQADTIMIHHYLGAGPVGIYQAGMRVLVGALLVADALNGVYLSRLARTGQMPMELDRLGTQMTRHLLALGTMAFACTVAGGELIVHYLFDDGYAPLLRILPAFGVLMFVRYGGVSYGTVLTLSERQGVRVAAVSGTLVLSLALNALLVPRFGLAGAIAASIAGHLTLYSVYVVAAWREHRSFLIDRRSTGLLAAAVATIAWLAVAGPGNAALRLEVGLVLLAAAVLAGVTRAEWGSVAGRLTRQH